MLWRALIQALLLPLPWNVRRRALNSIFGYKIAPGAYIGYSIIIPYKRLEMAHRAYIGNFTVARGMDEIELGEESGLGAFNWIIGIPKDDPQLAGIERRVALVLDRGALVTSRHTIDCSGFVRLGECAVVAGGQTQIVSHAIDMYEWKMKAAPIIIGDHSMLGSRCILLPGAELPPRSALGAGSVLRKRETKPNRIYSGVPAVDVGAIDDTAAFFHRGRFLGEMESASGLAGPAA